MKIKLLLFLIWSLTVSVNSFSQINDFKWSQVIEKSSDQHFKKALLDDSKNVYLIKMSDQKGRIHLDIIDSLGNLTFSKSIELAFSRWEDAHIINDKLCVFATTFNTADQIDVLSVFQINNRGSLSSTLPLMKMESNGGYHSLFDPTLSPNKKYIGVVCTHPFEDHHSEEMTANIYNSDFSQVGSIHLSTSIPGSKRKTTVSAINDHGFIYILKKHRAKKQTVYDIFTVDSHGHHHHNNLHVKSKKIADMDYSINSEGALILAGFYSSPTRKNFEGVFAMELKESVYPTWSKSYILDQAIVMSFKSKKEIGISGYGLDRFHIKHLLIEPNGDILLSAEHHGVLQDKKLGSLDHRKGLVLARLNKSGGMKGVTAIQLNQKDGINAGYFSSHTIIGYDDATFVLSNKIGPQDHKIKANKSTGAAVHIEENKISKTMTAATSFPQFNPDFNNYLLQPSIQISNSYFKLILLESGDSKNYKVGFIHSIEN